MFDGRKVSPSEGVELSRGTEKERENQLRRLREFHRIHERHEEKELDLLKTAVLDGKNIFGQLMSTTRYCSFGQITSALFSVDGKYRRNM